MTFDVVPTRLDLVSSSRPRIIADDLASILLIAGIHIIAAVGGQPESAPPDILTTAGDPDETLMLGALSGWMTKSIRGLLMARQSGCPGGYGYCNGGG